MSLRHFINKRMTKLSIFSQINLCQKLAFSKAIYPSSCILIPINTVEVMQINRASLGQAMPNLDILGTRKCKASPGVTPQRFPLPKDKK